MTSRKPLGFKSGPMVWIDLEMSGLNPRTDKILEIAASYQIVDEGLQYIIRTDKRVLDGWVLTSSHYLLRRDVWEVFRMDEWCTNQHGKSGLTKACLQSPYSTEFVTKSVLDYIKKWVPDQRTAVLAGNSVHVDRTFLAAEMPEIVDWLHYRIVDVSSIKELARRWYPAEKQAPRPAETNHRALDDIRGSIRGSTQHFRSLSKTLTAMLRIEMVSRKSLHPTPRTKPE
ncbi:hypothetical protein H1R20_g8797, partial [Candolleomyces eurysporus]